MKKSMDFYDIPPQRGAESEARETGTDAQGRPFLGVLFDCCKQYARVYRNPAGTHYLGNCPRCARAVRFRIGEGGQNARFWKSS
jgi:hypothetical protein